jgi:phospholipase/carboxylesterase
MSLEGYNFAERPARHGAPLLFAFHGTGGGETQLLPLAAELAPEAHVIAPRGDVSEGGALRFFRRKAEGVYDMADLAARTQTLAGFVEAHKRRLQPSRVIGLGYSNGANILASTLFQQPNLFDDVVLMHPLIPWTLDPGADLSGLRALVTAGRNDPICPPALTQALAAYFAERAKAAALEWHPGGHELRPSEIEAARRFLGADRPA